MITLYDHWQSTAAYGVRIALGLLGLPYTAIPVNLLDGSRCASKNLLRNPQGLVPTLEIDGQTPTQSVAIFEYLDETRSAGFLPEHPAARARVCALAYAIAMEISPVCNLSVRNHAATASAGAITADCWQSHFMAIGLAAFECSLDHPATGLCCHGTSISIADICLVPQIYIARRPNIVLATLPNISRIMAHLDSVPAIAAAHSDLHRPVV